MRLRRPSLLRRLAVGFFVVHACAVSLLLIILYPAAISSSDEPIGPKLPIMLLERDLIRLEPGRLALRRNAGLDDFAGRNPGVWFVARIEGEQLSYGLVPAALPQPGGTGENTLARYRSVGVPGPAGDVMIDRVETDAGIATVIAGGVDTSALSFSDYYLFIASTNNLFLPLIAATLSLLGALIAIPLVLRALRPTAEEAERLDAGDPDARLSEAGVVIELLPIVRAFNAALDRLRTTMMWQRRLIADVAHELKTPLAVLNMRVERLGDETSKPDLQRLVFRLDQMVGQMLDAERLALAARPHIQVDLVPLVRTAVADIAPLAIAQGYDISVIANNEHMFVNGDPHSVSRAVANLLGNAVAHGGNTGTISAVLAAGPTIEIVDQGPGIAAEVCDRIFEPFHRERWDKDGCGLGLHLVREVMHAHRGHVDVHSTTAGSTFKLSFPPAAAHNIHIDP